MQEPIDRYFAAQGFDPNVVMRFDNAEFIRSMVRAGMGIALFPLWVVDRDLKERRLSIITPGSPPLLQNRPGPPQVRLRSPARAGIRRHRPGARAQGPAPAHQVAVPNALDSPEVNDRSRQLNWLRRQTHATIPAERTFYAFQLPHLVIPVVAARRCRPPAASTQSEVYVVPFSHLDLYWGGTQEECLSRSNRIISRAVNWPRSIRTSASCWKTKSTLPISGYFPRIAGGRCLSKNWSKAGRIEIAPVWAGIYQNLPRAEALVRNVVYGKRYARDEFGIDPKVAHLADIPGFTRQYPQILRKTGTPYMVMTRMGPPDNRCSAGNRPTAPMSWSGIPCAAMAGASTSDSIAISTTHASSASAAKPPAFRPPPQGRFTWAGARTSGRRTRNSSRISRS